MPWEDERFVLRNGYRHVVMVLLACILGVLAAPAAFAIEVHKNAEADLLSLEMGESPAAATPDLLFVSPEKVIKERAAFETKLPGERRQKRLRPLYETAIDQIGANGILDGIEKLWPRCHSQAMILAKSFMHGSGTLDWVSTFVPIAAIRAACTAY